MVVAGQRRGRRHRLLVRAGRLRSVTRLGGEALLRRSAALWVALWIRLCITLLPVRLRGLLVSALRPGVRLLGVLGPRVLLLALLRSAVRGPAVLRCCPALGLAGRAVVHGLPVRRPGHAVLRSVRCRVLRLAGRDRSGRGPVGRRPDTGTGHRRERAGLVTGVLGRTARSGVSPRPAGGCRSRPGERHVLFVVVEAVIWWRRDDGAARRAGIGREIRPAAGRRHRSGVGSAGPGWWRAGPGTGRLPARRIPERVERLVTGHRGPGLVGFGICRRCLLRHAPWRVPVLARTTGRRARTARLPGAVLSGVRLPGVRLPGVRLSGAGLSSGGLPGVRLFGEGRPRCGRAGRRLVGRTVRRRERRPGIRASSLWRPGIRRWPGIRPRAILGRRWPGVGGRRGVRYGAVRGRLPASLARRRCRLWVGAGILHQFPLYCLSGRRPGRRDPSDALLAHCQASAPSTPNAPSPDSGSRLSRWSPSGRAAPLSGRRPRPRAPSTRSACGSGRRCHRRRSTARRRWG